MTETLPARAVTSAGAPVKAQEGDASGIGGYSPFMFGFFARVFERTLRSGTHRVQVAASPTAAVLATPWLVIYTNHPSWWDGILFIFLARRLVPGRRVFSPIDSAMMARYRFFARIGGFAVTKGQLRGAREFAAGGRAVLADRSNVLLIAAQDRFADPRERPLRLAAGLTHLAGYAPLVTFLPLAIEYPFRDERRPDVLLRFGEPIRADAGWSREALATTLDERLAATMDILARDCVARDDTPFRTVLSGSAAINIFYDGWRRVRALLRGEPFRAGHGTDF